jgi:hypothetical protein
MSTLAGSVIARPTLFALLVAVLAHPAGAAPPAYTAVDLGRTAASCTTWERSPTSCTTAVRMP